MGACDLCDYHITFTWIVLLCPGATFLRSKSIRCEQNTHWLKGILFKVQPKKVVSITISHIWSVWHVTVTILDHKFTSRFCSRLRPPSKMARTRSNNKSLPKNPSGKNQHPPSRVCLFSLLKPSKCSQISTQRAHSSLGWSLHFHEHRRHWYSSSASQTLWHYTV